MENRYSHLQAREGEFQEHCQSPQDLLEAEATEFLSSNQRHENNAFPDTFRCCGQHFGDFDRLMRHADAAHRQIDGCDYGDSALEAKEAVLYDDADGFAYSKNNPCSYEPHFRDDFGARDADYEMHGDVRVLDKAFYPSNMEYIPGDVGQLADPHRYSNDDDYSSALPSLVSLMPINDFDYAPMGEFAHSSAALGNNLKPNVHVSVVQSLTPSPTSYSRSPTKKPVYFSYDHLSQPGARQPGLLHAASRKPASLSTPAHTAMPAPRASPPIDCANPRSVISKQPADQQSSPKPFVCRVPSCGKRYKNANGLKYHMSHGHIAPDERKPFCCPVAMCRKRYKNPNGLKYHMRHGHPRDGRE